MSRRNSQTGFSLVELLIVLSVIGILFASFSSFFTNYLILYSKYQKDGTSFTELASQSQRVSQVLRGVTDIVSPSADDLSAYAYFSPNDAYTSLVHYYIITDSGTKKLMADVTPMTANPPEGTLISSEEKTYTIISDFYQPAGTDLFNYYDASGTLMSLPISDQHNIISIQVNLATPASHSDKGQTLSIAVSLRNRKTNL